jgi:cytochrome c oxidase cbb3-type subunit III
MRIAAATTGLCAAAVVLALVACEREERRFRETPPTATALTAVTLSDLQPGPRTKQVVLRNPYDGNAYAISEGQRLFSAYNCSGCHANGGGGMGPPLMDDEWIYGSEPENIFSTIVEGRPNGMPSFRGRIPDSQVWELVAYVRSLSGLTPSAARSSRQDHMIVSGSQSLRPAESPKSSSIPPGAQRP